MLPLGAAGQFVACGCVGFGLYGPQNMIALAAAELVNPEAVGPAQVSPRVATTLSCPCLLLDLSHWLAQCLLGSLSVSVLGSHPTPPRSAPGTLELACLTTPAPAARPVLQGIIGFLAYMGAAAAGSPVALLVQRCGWDAFFAALLGACTALALCTALLLGAKSCVQRQLLGKPADS